jgi:hypothetical protein
LLLFFAMLHIGVATIFLTCFQLVTFMARSFVIHVAIVVNMLHLCSLHVATVPCKCFKIKSNFLILRTLILDVADVESRCFSDTWCCMLQILIFDVADVVCDVGCCVDCRGGGGGGPLMLRVANIKF